MAWQTTIMPFGKHKGKTIGEIAKKEPGYIVWMYQNITDGTCKRAAGAAIKELTSNNVHSRERPDIPESMKIKLIRDTDLLPNGMLAIKVSGRDTTASFEELNDYCRAWDVDNEWWCVPVTLLGDILDRFPDARLYGELKGIVDWTEPISFERQLNVTPLSHTPLPKPLQKEKIRKMECKWEHLKDLKPVQIGYTHDAED